MIPWKLTTEIGCEGGLRHLLWKQLPFAAQFDRVSTFRLPIFPPIPFTAVCQRTLMSHVSAIINFKSIPVPVTNLRRAAKKTLTIFTSPQSSTQLTCRIKSFVKLTLYSMNLFRRNEKFFDLLALSFEWNSSSCQPYRKLISKEFYCRHAITKRNKQEEWKQLTQENWKCFCLAFSTLTIF